MTNVEPETEESLRRYVLGTLEEDSRLQLEEQLVQDPDVFEALGVIEDELTEEYLDETLTVAEKLAYERQRSVSPDRRRAPEFFKALRRRASARAAEPRRASVWTPARWFRPIPLQPAWLGAAAALLVVSLVGNAWLALGPSTSGGSVAIQRPATEVPTFTLAAGLLRSGGSLTRVVLPADVDVVRLALDLPADEYPLYRAALEDVDGNEIWAQSRLKAETTEGQVVVSVLVPAAALARGDYQMKVSGLTESGDRESLARYTFRALPD
jgi:hypothetical protein